ncbi:MAG: PEP-CTERM sorting domain-containing protein, partial [Pirellulales bacterium]|nr:PEP-CTERM sorting domain-containing protein [Pirellulales bacterium]
NDFLIWQIGLGLTGQTNNDNGDANGDGTVDQADLTVWQSQFGSPPPAMVTAIPEPATWLLLVLLIVPLALRRR